MLSQSSILASPFSPSPTLSLPSPPTVLPGVSDSHCQANGQEELSSKEPGGRRDSRLHLHHLLRQDGHADPEPYDGGPHVVRQPDP